MKNNDCHSDEVWGDNSSSDPYNTPRDPRLKAVFCRREDGAKDKNTRDRLV